jgi:hypothetical protein
MMRPLSSRAPVWILSVCAAFVAGVAFEHFGREAHADSVTSVSTLYVPAGGLVFRSIDGTPLARISRDSHGGTLELYDEHGELAPRGASRTPTAVPAKVAENPYVDIRDPFTTSAASDLPGLGY